MRDAEKGLKAEQRAEKKAVPSVRQICHIDSQIVGSKAI